METDSLLVYYAQKIHALEDEIVKLKDELSEIHELADSYPELSRHTIIDRIYSITKHILNKR